MSEFGAFTCTNCGARFEKADEWHGSNGLCCQCEIALGIILLHEDKEANEREQLQAKHVIAKYKLAFAG